MNVKREVIANCIKMLERTKFSIGKQECLSILLRACQIKSWLRRPSSHNQFLDGNGRSRLEVDRDAASWFLLALTRVDSLDREIALMVKR